MRNAGSGCGARDVGQIVKPRDKAQKDGEAGKESVGQTSFPSNAAPSQDPSHGQVKEE